MEIQCWMFFAVVFFDRVTQSKDTLDLLIMGDFGGQGDYPYTTTNELNTAQLMGTIASKYDVDAVFSIGDNFYPDGVENASSFRFNATFESVFTAKSLQDIPFYFVAGNHDYRLNVSAQIAYSQLSKRWNFPDYYYNQTFTFTTSNHVTYTVDILMIDTIILTGQSYGRHLDDITYCQAHNISFKGCSGQPLGPTNVTRANQHYSWIENMLANSDADYLFVVGHYPIYSVGEHGPTDLLVQYLNPLLFEYNVTAYISGHDHTFEYYLVYANQTNGGNTTYMNSSGMASQSIGYVVTGGASDCEGFNNRHIWKIPDYEQTFKYHGCDNGNGGFTRFTFTQNALNVYFYNGNDSAPLYSTAPLYPRKTK